MKNDFAFQLDFLSWEFGKLYRPKIILLVIVFGFYLTMCNKPNSSRKAQVLVLSTIGANEPWQYRSTIEDLNKAVKLAPNLPEAYAARGNLYSHWSNFLLLAETNTAYRNRAEGFNFDLKAGKKYRTQALKDYQKSLELLKTTDNIKLTKEVIKARSCLKTKSDCYAHIHFTKFNQ